MVCMSINTLQCPAGQHLYVSLCFLLCLYFCFIFCIYVLNVPQRGIFITCLQVKYLVILSSSSSLLANSRKTGRGNTQYSVLSRNDLVLSTQFESQYLVGIFITCLQAKYWVILISSSSLLRNSRKTGRGNTRSVCAVNVIPPNGLGGNGWWVGIAIWPLYSSSFSAKYFLYLSLSLYYNLYLYLIKLRFISKHPLPKSPIYLSRASFPLLSRTKMFKNGKFSTCDLSFL